MVDLEGLERAGVGASSGAVESMLAVRSGFLNRGRPCGEGGRVLSSGNVGRV